MSAAQAELLAHATHELLVPLALRVAHEPTQVHAARAPEAQAHKGKTHAHALRTKTHRAATQDVQAIQGATPLATQGKTATQTQMQTQKAHHAPSADKTRNAKIAHKWVIPARAQHDQAHVAGGAIIKGN